MRGVSDMAFNRLDINRNQYQFGRLAFALYFVSLLGLGWIGFGYSLFPIYTIPIILTLVFGITGIAFAFASGGLRIDAGGFKLQLIAIAITSIFIVITLNVLARTLTPQFQSSVLLQMPTIVALAFFGFVGIQEEAFWRGIYVFMRRFAPGVRSFFLIAAIQAAGGAAYHQAVGRQLFGGTLYSSPEFFIWIAASWILYVALLEFTKNFGVSMLGHFLWNISVTALNIGLV